MSVIQKLRNKSGLITVLIGLALLSFVITGLDPKLFSSMHTPDNVIASINGTDYPYEAYYEFFEQVDKQYKSNPNLQQNPMQMDNMYNEAWNTFLNSKLFDNQFEQLGMGVYNENLKSYGISDKEFEDLTTGDHIDPQLQYYFRNQQTGQFDKEMLIQTLTNIKEYKEKNPEFYESWLEFEKSLQVNTLRTKYSALVTKAYNVTTLETEMAIKDKNNIADIEYIKIPFESIKDQDVKVTDAEIAAYYEKVKNSKKYQQQSPTATIEYISFDIIPTAEDVKFIESSIAGNAQTFKNTKNDEAFLNLNSDAKYDPTYYKKGTLPTAIDSFAFANPEKSITPIYLEGDVYKIAKISSVKFGADSAKVRHILVTGNDAMKKADSLKSVIEKGGDFGMLALKYSADSGSAIKGGLIDWFKDGEMVKPFQDTSFFGVKGKIYLSPSQYGVHIIEILDQSKLSKKVQVQYLAKQITYSQDTRKDIYKKAVQFASDNRTKDQFNATIAANSKLYTKKIAENIGENERSLPGVFDSRAVIRWAHQNKEDLSVVSEIFTCGDKYIIATIANAYDKGVMPLEAVKLAIKAEVIKEKKKEMLKAKLASVSNKTPLSEIGMKFNAIVTTAQNISFAIQTSPELGMEPNVFAIASLLQKGQQSSVIEGTSGMFIIKVVNKRVLPNTSDIKLEKSMLQQNEVSSLSNSIIPILKDKAEVEDYRLNFN